MLPNLVGRAADASLGWLWPSWRSKANRGQIQSITYLLPIWYLVSRWGLGPKVCMYHFGCGMNWIKGYYMIVKVKNETFWFSTYSMEMHSLTLSSVIICLWGETFGWRTILFWVGADRWIFFKSKSTLHGIIASLSPSEGANKSTSPKNLSLHTSFKPVLECKQVDNNNLEHIFKRSKFSKKFVLFFFFF